ncbi:MAG: DUF401 family protein, partial [Candidatus Marinimicrobia bacterium]|nr:DUF401 family protein [Candidatus Neomarinimicrobiota bacterium]
MFFVWSSFLISILLLLAVGRKNIWLGLMVSSFILGVLNLPFTDVGAIFIKTIGDPSIFLLALAVGIMPVIGGALSESGLIKDLIQSLNMRSKTFLFMAPAFMGMLTMPGGALLSAPVIANVGSGATKADYAAINIWFRHILVMIYPLAGLLATTKMAGIDLYTEVLYLLPAFLLLTLLGYLFILRPIKDNSALTGTHKSRKILQPIGAVMIAPVIHIIGKSLFPNMMEEIPLIVGVLLSLGLTFHFGKLPLKELGPITLKMRPWRFFLLILGMFIFLNVFKATDASAAIAAIAFNKTFLIVGIALFLGFVTGRVQVPVSILLPIYYAGFGAETMSPMVFAEM